MSDRIKTNRVLKPHDASELIREEIESVNAAGPSCRLTFTPLPE